MYNFLNKMSDDKINFTSKDARASDTFDSIFICPSCHNVIINEIEDNKLVC